MMTLFDRSRPSRRQQELDDMMAKFDAGLEKIAVTFAGRLDETVDELYTTLSVAYPGLYVDPQAPTSTTVEYRVHETTGQLRRLNPAAAVAAHRAGNIVERRQVTVTEWEREPNPNHRTQLRPVTPPVTVQQAIEAASDADRNASEVVEADLVGGAA